MAYDSVTEELSPGMTRSNDKEAVCGIVTESCDKLHFTYTLALNTACFFHISSPRWGLTLPSTTEFPGRQSLMWFRFAVIVPAGTEEAVIGCEMQRGKAGSGPENECLNSKL